MKLRGIKPCVITVSKERNKLGWLKHQQLIHTFTKLTSKQLEALQVLVFEGHTMVNLIAIARKRGVIPRGMKISDKEVSQQLINYMKLKTKNS